MFKITVTHMLKRCVYMYKFVDTYGINNCESSEVDADNTWRIRIYSNYSCVA